MKDKAYREGDLIRRDNVMGVVTKVDGRLVTISLVDGVNSVIHSTVNITVKQYLKIVKSQRGILMRNVTLEAELLNNSNSLNYGLLSPATLP